MWWFDWDSWTLSSHWTGYNYAFSMSTICKVSVFMYNKYTHSKTIKALSHPQMQCAILFQMAQYGGCRLLWIAIITNTSLCSCSLFCVSIFNTKIINMTIHILHWLCVFMKYTQGYNTLQLFFFFNFTTFLFSFFYNRWFLQHKASHKLCHCAWFYEMFQQFLFFIIVL